MADVSVSNREGVILKGMSGDFGHGQAGTLSGRPAEMFRALDDDAHEAGSDNLGSGVKSTQARLEPEVRVVENDDTNGPHNSIETPNNK